MIWQDAIVCPTWDSQKSRFRGGGRYKANHTPCSRCGAKVAVPLDTWKAVRLDQDVKFICEPCSLFLEQNPDLAETEI